MGRTLAFVLAALIAALVCFPHAHAQAPAAKEASARFRRGVELYRSGAYAEALTEFEQAYAVAPDYRVLYNIAESKVQLSDYLGGARAYERYLADGGAEIPTARRAQVDEAIERLGQRVGGIVVQSNRERAEVRIDGVLVGATPLVQPVPANEGPHVVAVKPPNEEPSEQRIELHGGEIAKVAFEFGPTAPLSLKVTYEPAAPPRRSGVRTAALVSGIAALPVAIASLITGVFAARAQNDVKQSELSERRAALDDRDRYRLSAATLGGAAGALAITSVALWIVDRKRNGSERPSVGLTAARDAGSVTLRLAF